MNFFAKTYDVFRYNLLFVKNVDIAFVDVTRAGVASYGPPKFYFNQGSRVALPEKPVPKEPEVTPTTITELAGLKGTFGGILEF